MEISELTKELLAVISLFLIQNILTKWRKNNQAFFIA
jgi:hypothetical protein